MARAARRRVGGRVPLAAALLGGLASAGCAPSALHLVVTGHGDGRLRLWDADSGRFAGISPD